jgi:hypothetical protein
MKLLTPELLTAQIFGVSEANVAANPELVLATSVTGAEFNGRLSSAPKLIVCGAGAMLKD